mgnify:CR=1 FL=1
MLERIRSLFAADPAPRSAGATGAAWDRNLAAAALLREHIPDLSVRVVNVVDLTRLQSEDQHPHGLPDREFDAIFTPDKPVICVCGDGGFFYHLPELETARRRGIKTVTIVNNNHCLSQGLRNLNIAYADRKDHSRKGECFEYLETDFAKVAQSFGCFGTTVDKPQDFRKAFEQAMASDLPAVIDVKTEFAVQAPCAFDQWR